MTGPVQTGRYPWITLALVLALAATAGLACFHFSCDHPTHVAARDGDVMNWMRHEFGLADAQYAEVLRLHEEQSEVCAQHCAAVRAARSQLAEAKARGEAAAVDAAERELHVREEICRVSTEAHVRRVAAAMAPEQGARYLAMVLPRLSALSHEGPPSPRLDR